MSAATLAPPTPTATAPVTGQAKWLFGPKLDAVLVANLLWPVVALAAYLWEEELKGSVAWTRQPLTFLQFYFISSPHRWITLLMVFGDTDLLRERRRYLAWLTVALVGGGLGLVGVTSLGFVAMPESAGDPLTAVLAPLMILDAVWNTWHFAAQHAGIGRIYGRMARPGQELARSEFEKSAVRGLVMWAYVHLYVQFGAANAPHSFLTHPALPPILTVCDVLAVLPAAYLLVRLALPWRPANAGQLLYTANVVGLYAALLVAMNVGDAAALRGLTLAAAVFHAGEYLAVCAWAMRKRRKGLWHWPFYRTTGCVLLFVLGCGGANWLLNTQSVFAWTLLTLLVSYLHYAYDGMIWKSRPAAKPA